MVDGVAKNTVAKVASDQVVLKVLERATYLRSLRLKHAFVLVIVEILSISLPVRHHEVREGSLLKQVEEIRL